MSIFNIHKNKAICVLPWVHEHLDTTGNQRPCCHGKVFTNNRTLKNVREEMLVGTQPIECQKCYNEEANKESSARIRETIDWIKKFREPNIENIKIQHLDVRNDSTCNLKCKTCGPEFSTLWAKEKNEKIKMPNYNLNIYDKKELKKIYMAGGEPTYNKSYLEFLQELYKVNPECEIIINTNLKRLSNLWKELIKMFKNLTVTISCDAVQDLGCYVRYPLDWKQFEENVKFVKDQANFIMFNLVPSNLTVHRLDQTLKWMSTYTKNISLSIVGGDIWTHKAIPYSHRHLYLENLNKLKNFPINPWFGHKFRLNLNSLIAKYESKDYDAELHQKLKQEIVEQDSHRTTQLRDVDPFLYSWIFAK